MSADSPDGAAVDYEFGLYRVDSRLRRLYKDGEPLMLTPKAFETLFALVERHGRVVEKDELMHVVWGDTFVGDDTLAQNISILRRALGDEPNRPQFIATVARRGYRFVASVKRLSVRTARPTPETPVFRRPPSFWFVVLIVCAGVAATIGVFAAQRLSAKKTAPSAVEFTVSEPEHQRFSTEGHMLALSPDGQQLAFVATDANGSATLWLRPLGSAVSRALGGTDGAPQPVWSPDSRMVAFFAERRLKTVDVASGAVRVVASLASARSLGGTWSRFGEILFSVPDDGMYVVPAAGGTPRRLAPDADAECGGCGSWPSFLPDGRRFLYTVASDDPATRGIYVAEIGKPGRQRLLDVVSSCSYAPPGSLFYARSGTLYTQPFDVARTRLTGAPVPLADAIAYNRRTGRVALSVSETGILAFRKALITELVWVDRAGTRQNIAARPATYLGFSIAPDGRRVAAARLDPRSGTSDVWVIAGERETRVTDDPDWDGDPVWSEDGDYVAYTSRRGNRWRIYRRKATAVAAEELLLDTDIPVTPLQMFGSADVVYAARPAKSSFDVWRLAEGRSTPLLRTGGFYPGDGRLSHGERWFAYSIPEADGGVWNQTVYVSSPRAPDNRRAIAQSASTPRWRADGQELFYLLKDTSLVAVPVDPRGTPSEAPGEVLFRTMAPSASGLAGRAYDVAPDGRRFLLKLEAGSSPIHVILNWEARVRR
jgi:DNA-binding winged helix-turn-helix (wHTH) protein/Tol biopolymer transport system component